LGFKGSKNLFLAFFLPFLCVFGNFEAGNALSHKLEVRNQCSLALAPYGTLTTWAATVLADADERFRFAWDNRRRWRL